jgi:CBS domain-containing protein
MAEKHISAIVVTNGQAEMQGILSTTDLTRASLVPTERYGMPALLPRHLMTADVIVTWPGEPLKEAVDRMLAHQVHRLVVVNDPKDRSHPVGILSMSDVARAVPQLP